MRTSLIALALIILAAGVAGYWYVYRSPAQSTPAVTTQQSPQDLNLVASTSPASTTPSSTPATPASGSHGTTTPVYVPAGTYSNVILKLGETGRFFGNMTLTPTYVVNDSRCPLGVFCIHFGTLTLAFDVTVNGATAHEVLPIGKSVVVAGHTITLKTVSPLKRMQTTIAPSDYAFTFSVE